MPHPVMAATKFLFPLVVALCASQVVLAAPEVSERQLRLGLSDVFDTVQKIMSGILNTLDDINDKAEEAVQNAVNSVENATLAIVQGLEDQLQKSVNAAQAAGKDVQECEAQQESIPDALVKILNDSRGCIEDRVQGLRNAQQDVDTKLTPESSKLQNDTAEAVKECSQAGNLFQVVFCRVQKGPELVVRATALNAKALALRANVLAKVMGLVPFAGFCSGAFIVKRVSEATKIVESTVQCIADKLQS